VKLSAAAALVVAHVLVALALVMALPVALAHDAPAFLLRDPLADFAVVVGFGIGAVMSYRMEAEQRGLGLLVGFCFAGGSVFLAEQFVVPGALGDFLLDTVCLLFASPGIAFATLAPPLLARRLEAPPPPSRA
jgi:hypothetical protein